MNIFKKISNTNRIAKSLYPIHELKDKKNYQKFILVKKNGETKTRIILFMPNTELREEVICIQFLSRYVQLFLEESVGVNFTSRDKPWDFELELSNSEKLKIEITAIADETELFKSLKSQERMTAKARYEFIYFHELVKLNKLFPDPEIQKVINNLKEQKIANDKLVLNPNYGKFFIFESSISENIETLDKLIKDAIDKKVNKNHEDKENVILIIDNRTVTFELEDIFNYLDNLGDYLANLPFKEVWLYTGYYSDNDGENAEYSFAPLKIAESRLEKLKQKLEFDNLEKYSDSQ